MIATRTIRRPHVYIDGILHFRCSSRRCGRAGEWLPEDDFGVNRNPHSSTGRHSHCRACQCRYSTEYNTGASYSRRRSYRVENLMDVNLSHCIACRKLLTGEPCKCRAKPAPVNATWFSSLPSLSTPGGVRAAAFVAGLRG